MSAIEEFRNAIEQAGLTPPDEILADGTIHRFASNGDRDDDAGWYVFFPDGIPAGSFGCWRSDLKLKWCAKSVKQMTAAERTEAKRRIAEAQRLRAEEETRMNAEAADFAQALLQVAQPAPLDHPYLIRKQVQPHGLRIDNDNNLIVPVTINGQIASVQFIPPEEGRIKLFLRDGATKGGRFVLGALNESSPTILIAEGFATSASLYEATGYPTSCAFSASNLLPVAQTLRRQFPSATIMLCGDNDVRTDGTLNTGVEAATKAAQAIKGLVAVPEAINNTKTDWNDVHTQLGLAAVLERIHAALAELPSTQEPETQIVGEPSSFHLTDVGNGQLFAQHHRSYIRYCYPLKSWFVCNVTSLWEPCAGNLIVQLAKRSIVSLYDEAQRETTDERRTHLVKHAVKSESAQRLQAMIDLARSEPGIPILPSAFDADPWLFSVVNGVLDLRTGTFRERQRGDLITKQSPVRFDPNATCPTWLHFLACIFGEADELIGYIQQVTGYCLTGLTVEQAFFLLWGSGSNGKSTLLKVLLKLFGAYGLQTPADTFLSRMQDGRATPDLARLQGARLVVAIESDEGCRLAEGTIKQMTGGDNITARRLYAEVIEFEPTHKILFATNHKPRVKDNTHAMWRRMRLIPFEVQIADHEQDPAMADKLLLELPGILNWALAGCLAWRQAGRLHAPEPVVAATQAYREEQDILDDFLHERTVLGPDESVRFSELRQEYVAWSKEASDKVMSSKAFAAALSERGYLPVRRSNARFYIGLRLRSVADVDVPMPVAATQGSADVDLDA